MQHNSATAHKHRKTVLIKYSTQCILQICKYLVDGMDFGLFNGFSAFNNISVCSRFKPNQICTSPERIFRVSVF